MLSHELKQGSATATTVVVIPMRCNSSIVENEPRYAAFSSSSHQAERDAVGHAMDARHADRNFAHAWKDEGQWISDAGGDSRERRG
jgi:hypothetical protein